MTHFWIRRFIKLSQVWNRYHRTNNNIVSTLVGVCTNRRVILSKYNPPGPVRFKEIVVLKDWYFFQNSSLQATLAPPVTGKMIKGIGLCYSVVIITFYPVAVSGYWAFGNQAQGNIFDNLAPSDAPQLLPQWLVGIASIAIVLQLLPIGLVRFASTSSLLYACKQWMGRTGR